MCARAERSHAAVWSRRRRDGSPARVRRESADSGEGAITAGHGWVIGRGLLAVTLGAMVLFPSAEAPATALSLPIGASAVVFGALLIGLGFRLRPNARPGVPTTPAGPSA